MADSTKQISYWMRVSIIFMFMVMAWLTVSLPFVTAAKGAVATEMAAANSNDNPLAGTTEEKVPGQVNLSEEYIHHGEYDLSFISLQTSAAYIHARESTYRAYHGEPPCPPPNHLS